jgi:hypothetical protein
MIDEPLDTKLAPGADPDPASPRHAPEKLVTEARAGVATGRMRRVLRISLALVVVAFIVAWLIGAHG